MQTQYIVTQEVTTADTWPLIQDSSGRVLDEYSLRKVTFSKGIPPEIRPEAWLFLLSYYSFSSTREERKEVNKDKRSKYEALLSIWKSPRFVSDHNFLKHERVIEKDCLRTDRHLEFYSEGNGNTDKLRRILTTFVIHDPELGYVQGMNDILSPLLFVLGSEHQAFWCFTDVMRRMHSTFSDLTLSQPLDTVARLCCYASPQLHDHISSIYDGEDWIFCFRWILINFKREFSMSEIVSLWERIWSNHVTSHFQLFFAAAMLLYFKQQLLQCSTVEDFMELTMKLSGNVPFIPVLSMAQALLEQLKGDEYCPYELRYLVSSSGCAPPPLVGFVRARQSFTTLHSSKILLQRNQIWTSLFGDAPVQPITSPFTLSPVAAVSQSNYSKMILPGNIHNHAGGQNDGHKQHLSGDYFTNSHNSVDRTVECKPPPPKEGFLPRENGIRFRDDIRNIQKVPAHTPQSQPWLPALCNGTSNNQKQAIISPEQDTSNISHLRNSKFHDSIPDGTACDLSRTPSSHQLWSLLSSDSTKRSQSVFTQEMNQDLSLQICELNFDSLRSEAELFQE